MGLPIGWVMPSCEKLNDREIYETCDNHTDELRLLGNGVVPATVAKAWEVLAVQINKGGVEYDSEKN